MLPRRPPASLPPGAAWASHLSSSASRRRSGTHGNNRSPEVECGRLIPSSVIGSQLLLRGIRDLTGSSHKVTMRVADYQRLYRGAELAHHVPDTSLARFSVHLPDQAGRPH